MMDDWEDDDLFYDDTDYLYDDYFFYLEDMMRCPDRDRIVEITDTGCDACSPRVIMKNKEPISKLKEASNPAKKETNKKANVTRRSGGDNQNPRNWNNSYSFSKDDSELLEKKSLDSVVVSSLTFNIADLEAKGCNIADLEAKGCKNEEDLEDFKEIIGQIVSRKVMSKKRFTDRAVDNDSLSGTSRCSMKDVTSISSIRVNPQRGKSKARTQESPSSKNIKEKKLIRSHENIDGKFHSSTRNTRTSTNQRSRTNVNKSQEPSARQSTGKKGNIDSKKNFAQSEQKLGSISRTIIKETNAKNHKKLSAIPRPIPSFGVQRTKNRDSKKKFLFEGSRLPVWQGFHKTPTATSKYDDIQTKTVKGEKEIKEINNFILNADDKNSSIEETIKPGEDRTIIVESEEEEIRNFSRKSSKLSDSFAAQKVTFAIKEVKGGPEAENIRQTKNEIEDTSRHKVEEIMGAQSSPIAEEVANNTIAAKKKVEDQSESDLWSRNYEEAYIKGRAVGLKIYRMAKAAREERKREFQKYGFEDYKKRPRGKPQEIVDIGVSLVEKVVDNCTESLCKKNYINIQDVINQRYSISKLNLQ